MPRRGKALQSISHATAGTRATPVRIFLGKAPPAAEHVQEPLDHYSVQGLLAEAVSSSSFLFVAMSHHAT